MARKLSRRDLSQYAARQLIDGVSQVTVARQLAAYLIDTRRTNELGVIIRDIAAQLADSGHIYGTVTTAHELSSATTAAIKQYAKQKTGVQNIALESIVDESVIGGMKLELPGYELDTTIARHLTILKTRYKKA